MARVTLNLNNAALHQVAMQRARYLVTRTTRQTLNLSAVKVPVDTGTLRASGSMRIGGFGSEVRGQVEYTARYSAVVHNGSPPRIIRPRRGQYLKFQVGGRTVYARQVNHPGTRARPFLADALRQAAGSNGFTVTINR